MEVKITIDLEDYRALTRGWLVTKRIPNVGLISFEFADIGFEAMLDEIRDAAEEILKQNRRQF